MKQQNKPPYGLYAATLAGLVVVRFADLLTSQSDFAATVYASSRWRVGLALAALAISWVTARYVRSRVPKLMGLLLCALVGGATTLLTASYVGMVIGGTVGLFSLFDRPRSFARGCVRLMGRLLRPVVPAIAAGFVSGVAAWILIAQFGLAAGKPIATGLATVACGIVLWLVVALIFRSGRRWYGWIGAAAIFAALCLIGFVICVWGDRARRQQAVATSVVVYPYSGGFAGAPPKTLWSWLWPGLGLVLNKETTDQDLSYLAGLPVIESLHIEGSGVTAQGVARLQLDQLIEFGSVGDAPITQEMLAKIGGGRKLQSLQLTGKQFTDQRLLALKSQPNLTFLSLIDTQITSAGFETLFGAAPPLWYVDLRNTNVDDEVFAPLSRAKKLKSLWLSGTQVTGSGLAYLRGFNVSHLDLSGTPLEEKYLEDLMPQADADQQAGLPAGVSMLNLADVRISAEGIRTLSKMDFLSILNIPDADVDDVTIKPLANLTLQQLGILANKLSPEGLKNLSPIADLNLHFDAAELELATICSRAVDLLDAHRDQTSVNPGWNIDSSVTIKNLDISSEGYDHAVESLDVLRHEAIFRSTCLFGAAPADYSDLRDLEDTAKKIRGKDVADAQKPKAVGAP